MEGISQSFLFPSFWKESCSLPISPPRRWTFSEFGCFSQMFEANTYEFVFKIEPHPDVFLNLVLLFFFTKLGLGKKLKIKQTHSFDSCLSHIRGSAVCLAK